jgi:hypothetical protein
MQIIIAETSGFTKFEASLLAVESANQGCNCSQQAVGHRPQSIQVAIALSGIEAGGRNGGPCRSQWPGLITA